MQSEAKTPKDYVDALTPERRKVIKKLRTVVRKALPNGFKETMGYGMIAYVVPLSVYPSGYHCKADTPLPFISLASQKNFVALYHMGIYSDPELMSWFKTEYASRVDGKLDMGKSCIRFKKLDQIPYDLVGELCGRMTAEEWIAAYEGAISRK